MSHQWPTTELHLLGGPFVTRGDVRLEVPEGGKRLLAFVGLRRRRLDRRQVAGALWSRGDDLRAASNLRSALWRLRGAGIDIVTADRWSVHLADDVCVDVHDIGDWATRLLEGRPRAADLVVSPSFIDGLDLLPGIYDDWALLDRERLRQRIMHALEAMSRWMVKERRFGEAVEAAMLSVAADPLRESAHRALIEAHLAERNLVEARRRFQAFDRLIRRELGVPPSPELANLCAAFDRHRLQPAVFPSDTDPRRRRRAEVTSR